MSTRTATPPYSQSVQNQDRKQERLRSYDKIVVPSWNALLNEHPGLSKNDPVKTHANIHSIFILKDYSTISALLSEIKQIRLCIETCKNAIGEVSEKKGSGRYHNSKQTAMYLRKSLKLERQLSKLQHTSVPSVKDTQRILAHKLKVIVLMNALQLKIL